ncbi:MAG: TRAP transporter substrate-binding protein [Lawsonibacter sp.]|nr:TRAP transporter substrate-binding protein [Lawsonibacter sp.]
MKKKLSGILAAVCALSLLLSGCGSKPQQPAASTPAASTPAASNPASSAPADPGKEPRVFRIGAVSNPTDIMAEAGQMFCDLATERLGGEIIFEYYPGEQLGNSSVMLENMQVGLQEGMTIALDSLSAYSRDLNIMAMAFAFEDMDHLMAYLESDYGKAALDKLEDSGFHMLNYNFQKNPRCIFGKKPITCADDLKGVKFRIADIEIFQKNFSTLGAVPTVVAWSEYTYALMQGVVDAGECTYENITANGFHLYAPYISLVDYAYALESIILTPDAWNSLTPEQQEIVSQCAEEASEMFNEKNSSSWTEQKAQIEQEGGQFVEFDKESFIKKMEPLAAQLESEGFFDTPGLYDYVQQLRG